MEYYYPAPSKIKILSDGEMPTADIELSAGDELNLSIKDYEFTDGTPKILWYVNDQLVSEGPTLNYKPQTAGKYDIYVTVNSAKSDFSITLNVAEAPQTEKMPMWQIWLISTAIVIALAGSVILTVYLIKKSKK